MQWPPNKLLLFFFICKDNLLSGNKIVGFCLSTVFKFLMPLIYASANSGLPPKRKKERADFLKQSVSTLEMGVGWGKFKGYQFCESRNSVETTTKPSLHLLWFMTQLLFGRSVLSDSLRTPWTAAWQASLSFTVSWSLLKLMSIASVMPSNHLILCCPLLLMPSIFPVSGSFPVSSLFASGGQVLELQLQHQFFQWIFRVDLL